ncbi:MAG: DUF2515 family protein [Bacilli bacterium]
MSRRFVFLRAVLTAVRRAASFGATGLIRARRKWRRMRSTRSQDRGVAAFEMQLDACLAQTSGDCGMFSDLSTGARPRTRIARGGSPAALDLGRLRTDIARETSLCNRNNLSRTEAYRRIYSETPDLHWALLAHLVSRNGGWNMTDLRGDLGRLLTGEDQRALFAFLERCNRLIFQDAYPQLRICQESLKRGRPLFALCRDFGVSRFMEVAWTRFWSSENRQELTVALIINEQSFIEERVVKDPAMRKEVFERAIFNVQSLFHMTAVLLPAYRATGLGDRVYGNFVRDFTSLEERIEVGKMLYALLFGGRNTPRGRFLRFAQRVPHTGSREDYAPALFSAAGSGCGHRLYSPALTAVWPDQKAPRPGVDVGGDWCADTGAVRYLRPGAQVWPWEANITGRYLRNLAVLRTITK